MPGRSPRPSGCCNGGTKRSIRPATARATCSSSWPYASAFPVDYRGDAFVTGSIQGKIWPVTVESTASIQQYGGRIVPFSDDARAAVQAANEKIVNAIADNPAVDDGQAFVSTVRGTADKWSGIVSELGYTNETDYNGFATWYTPEKIDITPYVERFYEEILLPHRPS